MVVPLSTINDEDPVKNEGASFFFVCLFFFLFCFVLFSLRACIHSHVPDQPIMV